MVRILPELSLLDLPPSEARERITAWTESRTLPRYRIDQIVRRLWTAPVPRWDEATELPRDLRDELAALWPLPRLDLAIEQKSTDGTRKLLWRLADGETIESVLIPSGDRRTLCISSQAGCALRCAFCATGAMGFRRNLSAFEIAGQVRELVLRDPTDKPTNIVFMGMGEPLLNWPAVDPALSILNDPEGFAIGARHITVSTVGILPGLEAFARRPEQFRLAISLHATQSTTRQTIMPVERKYDMGSVLRAAENFRQRVTFEYVVIRGVNDSDGDAARLGALARKLGAFVNLLPLHPGGGTPLEAVGGRRMYGFAERVRAEGAEVAVRKSRGLDISAACGQLRTEADGAVSRQPPDPAA